MEHKEKDCKGPDRVIADGFYQGLENGREAEQGANEHDDTSHATQ